MLVVIPTHRATLEEIISHPWLSKQTVADHLPKREPISLPIDHTVVDRMGGFQFGSKEDIIEKLTTALSSKEGYGEPIVKIYYLVVEKMTRKSMDSNQQRQSLLQSNLKRASTKLSMQKVSEVALDVKPLPLRRSKSLVNGEEKRKKHKNFRLDFHSRFKSKADGTDGDGEKESTFSHMRKRFSMKTESKQERKVPGERKSVATLDRERRTLGERNRHHSSSSDKTEVAKSKREAVKETVEAEIHASRSEPVILEGTADKVPIRKPSIGQKLSGFFSKVFGKKCMPKDDLEPPPEPPAPKPLLSVSTYLPEEESKSKVSVRSSVLSITPFRNSFSNREPQSPIDSSLEHHPALQYRRPSQATTTAEIGQLDDLIEKVAFTGIFSVSTTSTKPPVMIRSDILEVLKKMMHEYQMSYFERRGVITVMVANNDSEVEGARYLSKNSSLGSRRPSLALSTHSTDRESIRDRDYMGDPSLDHMARSSKVVFQIRIHKIKMMAMHCIRFQRVEGDTWVYKSLCSKFLEILNW
jgi:hypothetical protein